MLPNRSGGRRELIPAHAPISRIELALLLGIIMFGLALRAWKISDVGLDHFDEGVYAFSALGLTDPSQPHRLHPVQTKLSPPVFFSLIGLSYYVFGEPWDIATILVNVTLGTLCIPAVWWITRTWFQPPAGVAAAAPLALNEFHITLSRAALTDIAFALLFVLALAASVAALQRNSIGLAALAGLTVGLAWNTKYHGWLALVIVAAAWLLFTRYRRARGPSLKRTLLLLGVVTVVAAACYLPGALFIESQPGGYAALARYQRRFLSRDWLENLWTHSQMQFFFDGPISRCSMLIAFFCALTVQGRKIPVTRKFLLSVGLLSGSALLIGGSGTAVLLAVATIPALLRNKSSLPGWVLLSWMAAWFLWTPLYHPYGRLVLPFTIATHLAAGVWMSNAVEELGNKTEGTGWRPIWAAVAAATGVALIALSMPDPSNPWRPSRSVSEAASAMLPLIPPGSRVLVIGEPALAFYLHLAGRPAFEGVKELAVLEAFPSPPFIVTGVYAKRAPEMREALERIEERLTPLGVFPMSPKDIRVLDDFVPSKVRLFRAKPDNTYELTLYRLSPRFQD